jgi:hypothetical protein
VFVEEEGQRCVETGNTARVGVKEISTEGVGRWGMGMQERVRAWEV